VISVHKKKLKEGFLSNLIKTRKDFIPSRIFLFSLLCYYQEIVKAIILAGGKGTRMGHLTTEIPKPMLLVGDEPVLVHQIRLLKRFDITDITILVNYLKNQIIEILGDGSQFGVSVTYFDEHEPLGTVGGIKEIEDKLVDDFLVFYGDVMINMHLGRLIGFHEKKNSECTLVLHPNDHPFDSDLVETDSHGSVTRFFPKPHIPEEYYPNLVNAGVYIFSPSIFSFLEKGKKADFGHDVFPAIYDRIRMFGYNTAEYLKDMGTPERLIEVDSDYRSGKIKRSSYDFKQKAIFLDRDGVINEEISFISKPEDMRLYEYTPAAIRKINLSEYKAIVVTNQSVIARNLCTPGELKIIHNKMETELGRERARLDALYYCPHHPDRGYPEERSEYKMDCLCRKPKPGMFLEAAYDFNLDLSKSYMIGDSGRDIEAAYNAGCISVGVMSGYGMRKTTFEPDFFFTNLSEAVDFIIDEPYKHVYDRLNTIRSKEPTVVLIGGNAKSGKSTLTTYLKLKMEQEGRKVLRINLDNWILPEKDRSHCKDVYDRFQLLKIETDLQQILVGINLPVQSYVSHPERKSKQLNYQYTGQDYILIDGVVALSSEILRELAQVKIFTEVNPVIHRKRIEDHYRWRGKEEEEIDMLYTGRLADEYRLIDKERKFADFIVNSAAE
jgi:D,D-heptose 1,7-bisphosphate phosphatase